MSDQTHYDGCWQDKRHHACALREIERLRLLLTDGDAETAAYLAGYHKRDAEIERLRAENERILKCIRWHRQALWNTRSIGHPYDIALYKETVEDERS